MSAARDYLLPVAVGRNPGDEKGPPTRDDLLSAVRGHFATLVTVVSGEESAEADFDTTEKRLKTGLFTLGRLLLTLFLCVREEKLRAELPPVVQANGTTFDRRPAQPRSLNTFFGPVRYWRTY